MADLPSGWVWVDESKFVASKPGKRGSDDVVLYTDQVVHANSLEELLAEIAAIDEAIAA